MTELEAKDKVCPFMSQQQYIYVPHANGWAAEIKNERTVELHQMCIGKRCMAWKWDIIQTGSNSNPTFPYSSTEGHCGRID